MVFVITPLPHPFVLYAPFTGRSSLSLGLGQLWLTLDHFRLLALPVGIALHHQLHSFILNIYIAPLQEDYSETLPTPARLKRAVLS